MKGLCGKYNKPFGASQGRAEPRPSGEKVQNISQNDQPGSMKRHEGKIKKRSKVWKSRREREEDRTGIGRDVEITCRGNWVQYDPGNAMGSQNCTR
jgi:hypothetical protein